ncbi:ABC transporter substrate-binding protein [Burkholderia multivorans]|uniref:ABC transporter substrate-binding protein n=1 Tax=Burkholderia multivorans TaxID=87883 RepID=UPI001FC8BF89|nr:ABC transporter substrate-binding protein [Burkholderia multivorans]MDN7867720.1 ABC transporter substrate-binding protein [Burkholderia multivorans]MDN8018900.1 ABC transporter substrate-binding protein [Burkholderia multivorans]
MFRKLIKQSETSFHLTVASHGRREFLARSACMAGGVLLGGTWMSEANAAGSLTLKATHGSGLCNCPFFLVKERNLAQGVSLDFVATPTNADIAALFGAGAVDVSVMPYTNLMTLYDAGAPIKVVAGSGVQGCVIVAQPGITSAAQLRGKTIGTFQADTLEMLPYDYLKKSGMSFADVKVRYFGTSPELAQAFISGNIDAMCHIEPYATQALKSRPGSVMLSNGVDVYGANYSDCVLAVREPLLHENRNAVKALIKAMMVAQHQEELDCASAVKDTVGKYFKTSYEATLDAATKQPAMIDQRQNEGFILGRAQNLKDLRYIKKLPGKDMFDWGPLAEVIKENPDLYGQLQRKSA